MAKPAKKKLPFDSKGGVIVMQRRIFVSEAWKSLSPQAKVLMQLMQSHWRNDKPVAYGVREAMKNISCAKGTAQRAFNDLQFYGFIELIENSFFSSRTQSKTRTWRLTWLPYNDRSPTNDWEKIKSTGSNVYPIREPQGQKCALKLES